MSDVGVLGTYRRGMLLTNLPSTTADVEKRMQRQQVSTDEQVGEFF